jgi:hypothetical protein
MDRAPLGLIGLLLIGLLVACTGTTPADDQQSHGATQSPTLAPPEPTPVGYPLPKGRELPATSGDDYPSVEMQVGDVIEIRVRPGADVRPDPEVVVVAERTATGYVFQAVGTGRAVVVTAPLEDADCNGDEPCVGRPAPPSVDITVTDRTE